MAADFLEIVDFQVPVDSPLIEPARLITDRDFIEFTSFQRGDTIGSGARSFTAAPDHDLIFASIAPAESRASPRGVIVVDGTEQPLPSWSTGDDGGTIVVSVPDGATSVALMVENDGRPQTISLLDGTLESGFPQALYRPITPINQPFSLRVEMPAGEALLISGQLTAAEWSARDNERVWLPEGESLLFFNFEEWDVDRPCCEVGIGDVSAAFVLLEEAQSADGPDAASSTTTTEPSNTESSTTSTTEPSAAAQEGTSYDDQREDLTVSPRSRSPFFLVPEQLSSGTLRIEVEVAITVEETESIVSAQLELMVDLP